MSDFDSSSEFLAMPPTHYPSDEGLRRNPVQPALNTLFSEFSRRHRSLSPSIRSSPRSARGIHQLKPKASLDLRTLEYVADYDSHLMCPICHVPFVDPVVLKCDHTFCASCFDEYRREGGLNGRSQCPSCRSYMLSSPHKASRLIHNMCQDTKVRCPNDGCSLIMARGSVEHHAVKICPEKQLACPDRECGKTTKRKNFVPEQCVHNSHVECECGAVIELGRGEWLRHKDQACPNTCQRCEKCGERLSEVGGQHGCQPEAKQECPGTEFGCTDVTSGDLDAHVATCIFARLSPHFRSQARVLQTMQEQLANSKIRNQTLETELDRMHSLIDDQIQPRLDQISNTFDAHYDDHNDNDIEEIPRDNIPSAAAIHHRDLLLPAHIRDLTPSPDTSSPIFANESDMNQSNSNTAHQMYNHLLYLHEVLKNSFSTLEADVTSLRNAMAELDARTSMQLMNETLRIKEDLAYTNAALVSNRSQVQWLLNRERLGRERMAMGQMSSGPAASEMNNAASSSTSTQQAESYFPSSSAGMTRTVSGSGSGSSVATSPVFSGTLGGRRHSSRGGSQERDRVKL